MCVFLAIMKPVNLDSMMNEWKAGFLSGVHLSCRILVCLFLCLNIIVERDRTTPLHSSFSLNTGKYRPRRRLTAFLNGQEFVP